MRRLKYKGLKGKVEKLWEVKAIVARVIIRLSGIGM